LAAVPQNGLKVFSCFACGGGSSMGYKLAGYTVLGNCEIDPKIAAVYKANLHPKYSFVMDVREFLKLPDEEIPAELFSLDVLDGSPPCSTFSTAGEREDAWGKEKQFAEGQKLQRLDDLFFTFIAIAKRLHPKVVIAENVKGLIIGNARGYVHEIVKDFNDAGYDVQLFLLNAARMGVPQRRERTFFIARRKDLKLPALRLAFNEAPIMFGEVREAHGKPFSKGEGKYSSLLNKRTQKDSCMADICKRIGCKVSGYNNMINTDKAIAATLIASGTHFRGFDGLYMTDRDCCNVSTFPQDYKFTGKSVQFVCGMSVPPVMMANIAAKVAEQCFGVKYDEVANG
jgi:DNA (cytosine-5)-methyltransferase 1